MTPFNQRLGCLFTGLGLGLVLGLNVTKTVFVKMTNVNLCSCILKKGNIHSVTKG